MSSESLDRNHDSGAVLGAGVGPDSGGDEQRSETRANPEAPHDSVSNGVQEAPAEPESTEKNNSGASNQESAITPKADSADGSPNRAQAANHPLAAEKAQPETAAPADLRVFHPLEEMEQDRPEDESATALGSTGARGSDQAEVAKEFASQAKAILGNAPTVVTARSDPQIPDVLRQSAGGGALERPTDRVFAVQCGNGWSALILTDFNALDTIQAKSSRFATALITTWDNAWILLFFDDGPLEPSTFPPPWLKGVTLIMRALRV